MYPLDDGWRSALTANLAGSLAAEIPTGTNRAVFGEVWLPGKATAVVGMRGAGKTTFLHQLRRERMAAGLARDRLPYINFEDDRLAGLDAAHLGFLVEEHARRVAGPPSDPVLWCFDEIQVVDGWERFVRRLLDSAGVEVAITGSSAALLSRELATAMRGRAWEVPIFPFSFREALVHRGETPPEDPHFLTQGERGHIERLFVEWLQAGGFPEAQGLNQATRRQLLRDYVDVAILRDVVERHRVTNVLGLRWLVRHLLGNAAAAFSVEKFHATLRSQGVAIARDTVHSLLAFLEDCFLVRITWLETASERQRMVNPRKVYPVDQGLIPVFDRAGRANLGHALETAVLIELERRRCEVTYVRTAEGFEVDFLAREPDGASHLIQVCADASGADTAARELRALEAARHAHPDATPWLLTLTRDAAPPQVPSGIAAMPAYAWMLGSGSGGSGGRPGGAAHTSS